MTANYIIVQVIGLVLIITTFITPHSKKHSNVLLMILITNLLSCAQFYFADAKAGLFGLMVATVRSVVYWGYSSKNKKAPLLILLFFIIAQSLATIMGWVDWFSILTLALILNTFGQWQTNEKVLRLCLLISAIIMGIYCFYTSAYTGAINKFLQAISTAIALYRTKKLQKNMDE